MSIKNVLFLVLFGLVAGCATQEAENSHVRTGYGHINKSENPTKIGMCYLLGRGVPESDTKAFTYFLAGANKDDPFAENELAYMYAAGKGTEQNYEKAFKYYQKAATHGLASAQYNLGLMYANGLGTEKNMVLAKKWYQKSATHGFEPAKEALANSVS